jgi:hypothetical protein
MHRQQILNTPPSHGVEIGGRKSSIHRSEMNDKSLSSSLVSTDTATTMRSISPITPRHHSIEPTPPKPCLTPERKKKQRKGKKKVRFDTKTIQHDYEFEGDYFDDYFFNRPEIKAMNDRRFDEADILRKERGIRTKSRKDADDIEGEIHDHFIGDALTHALDDEKDDHEISLRGIEHFVWPVLQKEMQVRKNAVRRVVIDWSIPKNRKKDPKGLKLAEESAQLSKWARVVATERGIKYCEMKRGGMLLKNTRNMWSDAGNRGNTRRNLGSLLRSITNKKVIEHKKRFGRIYGGQDDTTPLTPPRRSATGGTRHLTVED